MNETSSIIRINTETVRTKIELLKEQKEKIDVVLENFKGDSLKINDFWSGETGDEITESLRGYVTTFDYISARLERFITFLEGVCIAYDLEDENISRDVENLLTGLPLEKGIVKDHEHS